MVQRRQHTDTNITKYRYKPDLDAVFTSIHNTLNTMVYCKPCLPEAGICYPYTYSLDEL